MTRNQRQEALSRAYVQAIAGQAGMGHTPRMNDYGIDLSIHEIVRRGNRYCETGTVLDVQVKSTTRAAKGPGAIKYDLEVKAYEDLRDPDVPNPRLLILVLFPGHTNEWLVQSEEELIFLGCAYWVSLEGRPRTSRGRSVRIQVPRANVFSVPALRDLLDRLRTGGHL
jgi:Domain of unknown function (DUF4365)